jgi:hypothetical protein
MQGRGIAGVARQPVLPVGFRQVRSHLLFSFRLRINYRTWGGRTLRWLNPPPITGMAMFAAAASWREAELVFTARDENGTTILSAKDRFVER